MNMDSIFKLDVNHTEQQSECYNKNMELWKKTFEKADWFEKLFYQIGIQDIYIMADNDKFCNVYPYDNKWYEIGNRN